MAFTDLGERVRVKEAAIPDISASGVWSRRAARKRSPGTSRAGATTSLPPSGHVSGATAPLLIVGTEKDHTVPASFSHKQYEKYEKSEAQTDYVEYPGRPHLMLVAEGWEEIAGGIEGWLEGSARS
jgi:alpha-beta hydrolase superfamily lysophospholipase